MSISTILLILLLIGALPTWPYTSGGRWRRISSMASYYHPDHLARLGTLGQATRSWRTSS